MPPRGSSWSKAKYDRCVTKVKRRGSAYNPYAVCSAAAKRSRRVHGNPAPTGAREVRTDAVTQVKLVWELGGTRSDPDGSYVVEMSLDDGRGWFRWADHQDHGFVRIVVTEDGRVAVGDDDLREMGLARQIVLQQMVGRLQETGYAR